MISDLSGGEKGRAADVVYDLAVEAVLLGLGEHLTPALRAKMRALGVDPDRTLLASYPREVFVALVALASRETGLHPRELGARATSGFTRTPLGGPMGHAVRLIGVSRLLGLLPRIFTLSNNYTQVRLERRGPGAFGVELSHDVPSVDFICGSIEAMARLAGAAECSAVLERGGPQYVFGATWR